MEENNTQWTESETNEAQEKEEELTSNHTVNLIKAAMPYADSRMQRSMKLVVKATELMDTFQSLDNSDELEACDLQPHQFDMEGMLGSIRRFCNIREREMVDMILNFTNARKFYQTYRTVNTMMGGNEKNPFKDFSMNRPDMNMADMLSNMLTPEQKSTFDTMSKMFSTMNMTNS